MHKNRAIKFFLIEFRRSKKVENFYDIVAKKHMKINKQDAFWHFRF